MSELMHDKKCEWNGEEPSACDCKVRILESQLGAADELAKAIRDCLEDKSASLTEIKIHLRVSLAAYEKVRGLK